jgi:hypothetical protein
MATERAGKLILNEGGRAYRAEWKVVGLKVEITSEIGAAEVVLGALASAPATVARERFREMVRQVLRPVKSISERARFDLRDR